MDLKSHRSLFIVIGFVLVLVAAAPTLGLMITISRDDRSTVLWILGPEHTAENYPFNIREKEPQGPIYIGVTNHEGHSQYYLLYAKIRNQTQEPPNTLTSEPSSISPINQFRFTLQNGETWETPFKFSTQKVTIEENISSLAGISINNRVVPLNCSSRWNWEENGYYYQLFFELWLYNSTVNKFQFHNRFVGIWLNVTK